MSKKGFEVEFTGTGTSQGVPIIGCKCEVCQSTDTRNQRLRSSILIRLGDKTIAIDTGPDFRQQMLRSKVENLDAIIYTHEHRDHTAGFDDIRAFNYIMKKPMDVYCNHRVDKALRYEFHYAFNEPKYPGVPEANLHIIDESPFKLFGETIIPIPVMHHKLPVLGFRIRDFVYITDANFIPTQSIDLIKGCKVLVLNALRLETHISHFTLDEAVEIAMRVNAEQTYFTHISHQLGLHEEVNKKLLPNIALAYDGLSLTFS